MLKSFFLNLLFPIECLGCRQEGAWLCGACFKKINFGNGEKNLSAAPNHRLVIPYLDKILIAGDYDDPLLAAAIKKFKYNFISALGPILTKFLILFWSGQRVLPDLESSPEFLVIPLPLSKKRQRWRGFNQSEILAHGLSRHFAYDLSLDLKRVKHKKPQAALSEAERLNNARGVFAWCGGDLSDRTIILIDDVVTTGATLNEAARVLKTSGAKKVYGLVLAKG